MRVSQLLIGSAALLLFLLATPSPAQSPFCGPDLSGAWTGGKWESLADGHSGPLTANFERINASEYRVVFRGRFMKVIPFRYAVTLNVVGHAGDSVCLAGSSRLPFFGTYNYSATATACEFIANYTAAKDHGTFRLQR